MVFSASARLSKPILLVLNLQIVLNVEPFLVILKQLSASTLGEIQGQQFSHQSTTYSFEL